LAFALNSNKVLFIHIDDSCSYGMILKLAAGYAASFAESLQKFFILTSGPNTRRCDLNRHRNCLVSSDVGYKSKAALGCIQLCSIRSEWSHRRCKTRVRSRSGHL